MIHNKTIRNGEASPPEYSQGPYYEDEISLLDIWRVLVKQRKWIFIITALCVALSTAYALRAPKVYKTEAVILPPAPSDVEQLQNVAEIYKITGAQLYTHFLTNLKSIALRRQFFKKNNLLPILQGAHGQKVNSNAVFMNRFNKSLQINTQKGVTKASLEGRNPIQIAKWLNDFIAMADARTVGSISATVNTSIQIKKESIDRKIKTLSTIAKLQRLDKISKLEEAIPVAEKLNLKLPRYGIINEEHRPNSLSLGAVFNTTEQPLYLRGSKALKAEVNILKKRKNDDAFIPGLRNLQKQLLSLKGIKFNTAIHALRIDQPAYPPDSPVKPKRRLIVALGLVLGLMLGVFVAFIVNLAETSRYKGEAA